MGNEFSYYQLIRGHSCASEQEKILDSMVENDIPINRCTPVVLLTHNAHNTEFCSKA